MRRSGYISTAVCLLFLATLSLSAAAQDDRPAATPLIIKPIKLPSQLYRPLAFQDMHIFGSKKSVAILEGLEEDGSRQLHTLLLNKSGKTKLLGTLATEETIYTMQASLVWIDGAGVPGGSPASKGHYLLFFGGDTNDEWLSVVYMAKLSAAGKIIQQPKKVFEV